MADDKRKLNSGADGEAFPFIAEELDGFGSAAGDAHSETVYGEEIVPEHLDELPDIDNVEDYVGEDRVYDEETAGALVALMFAKEHREELEAEKTPPTEISGELLHLEESA